MLNEKIAKNILIIGAGRAGRLLLQDIRTHHPEHTVIGFVDDDPKIQAKNRMVLGMVSDLARLTKMYRLDEIIIAIPSADGKLVRRILLKNLKNRIPIRIVPRSQHVISRSDVRYAAVKELDYEDFLGQPFVRGGVEKLKKFYRGKTIFITGGAGSIGSEIVRQLIDLEVKKVIVYDSSEYLLFQLEQQLREQGIIDKARLVVGNILYTHKLDNVLREEKPDMIFHAAAYKHVHLMQDNIDEAVYNNVIGTQRLIDAALTASIPRFTFISTDKVVNPTSVMGATKKLCEYYIREVGKPNFSANSADSTGKKSKTKFNIVRFGNVINSNGSALPLFERQIKMHRYVTVTHKKMMRFFMSIREAAQLVIESSAAKPSNNIHILNMGELINMYEVAECLVRSKNLIPNEDVEMKIIGLRKGEKLVEELYTLGEEKNLIKGPTDRIFALKNTTACPMDIKKVIADLKTLVTTSGDQKALRDMLKQLFPSLSFKETVSFNS